ncbi:Ras GTPase activating protein ira2 [Coemansia spiralis]|nr:Ras GTPase activating protein ira2 [Coemansia spiralis]
MMSARVAVEKAADQVDEAVGISFRTSFSAALSLLLLRGMEDMSTKDEAYEVLLLVIGVVAGCRRWQQADLANPDRRADLIMPYLILILPTASARKELIHVFSLAGVVVNTDVKLAIEQGGFVRLLEQIHKGDVARESQPDYILYPSILAAMMHKTRSEQEITILSRILASDIAWVDPAMSLLVVESLTPTLASSALNGPSARLAHLLHDVLTRLALTRPQFDPDAAQLGPAHGDGLSLDTAAATAAMRKSVSTGMAGFGGHVPASPALSTMTGNRVSNLPPARIRDESADRNVRASTRSQDAASMLSRHSSTPSLLASDSFDRCMIPAHRDYLARIGFGGLGHIVSFDAIAFQWRELAELASLVVDQML